MEYDPSPIFAALREEQREKELAQLLDRLRQIPSPTAYIASGGWDEENAIKRRLSSAKITAPTLAL